MALIRSKPSGVSAFDYVRKLADDMRNGDGKILERCKSLEKDILHLRQKVALMSIRDGIRPEPPGEPFLFGTMFYARHRVVYR